MTTHGLMRAFQKSLLLASLLLFSSLSGCLFENDDSGGNGEILAVFTFSPTSNIRAGDVISFDGGDSTPGDGSLTYRWNFDSEGSIDIDATGRTSEWSYDEAKTFSVTLTVSDGTRTAEQTRSITVVEATAQAPTASITQYHDDEDCEDEEIVENSNIVLWICEFEKSNTDRAVSETKTVELDASESSAGDSSQYITDWYWDLDLDDDKDNDGDSENDNDLAGETVDWANVAPGEYEIGLTVLNDVGMTDSDTIRVYISYAGYWKDFEMGGNTSGNAQDLDFDVTIHYDKDVGNTISKATAELEYPQEDDDWVASPGSSNRNKLDIYAFNEEDDEASNTSATEPDSRDAGDCNDDEQDCVHLILSSYLFTETDSTYGDGEWTFTIRNERFNDIAVDQFVIRLHYK